MLSIIIVTISIAFRPYPERFTYGSAGLIETCGKTGTGQAIQNQIRHLPAAQGKYASDTVKKCIGTHIVVETGDVVRRAKGCAPGRENGEYPADKTSDKVSMIQKTDFPALGKCCLHCVDGLRIGTEKKHDAHQMPV